MIRSLSVDLQDAASAVRWAVALAFKADINVKGGVKPWRGAARMEFSGFTGLRGSQNGYCSKTSSSCSVLSQPSKSHLAQICVPDDQALLGAV